MFYEIMFAIGCVTTVIYIIGFLVSFLEEMSSLWYIKHEFREVFGKTLMSIVVAIFWPIVLLLDRN